MQDVPILCDRTCMTKETMSCIFRIFILKHISGTIAAIDLNHGKIIVLSFCYISKDICAPPISGMDRASMHVDGIR